ncbi:hypothetical protein G7B40_031555 [Aetokthonos hydrillicola Thurmond2011]|jgi:hypothetical protein|uniref:Uncharacterized protein n=1 Tax=Aetokthonos hydrillicola Thurmond2011 TaxID=2712845 RepID=A0AAP5ICL7_9CYAN|nr:hypothetical protein [Aetokthonos hydrillicola]MBO3462866.1 hypothetical protein [Aetokthonos hydrillicola CCALA 1050]MBW4590967.1 hypothetical protein [Aetokthonos hydrillicola CCALA 1050]MDR9899063.1 hypothetical protein [Aetokthonos hydrillicola Thurmond2011]
MTVKQLKQKSKKVAELEARLELIKQQENTVSRKVLNQRNYKLGEVAFRLLALSETETHHEGLDLQAFRKVVLAILDQELKQNHERELFGLPLILDNRESEAKKLIIEGNVLLKWLEWETISKEDYVQGLNEYLKRNSDRELFGLPPIDDHNTVKVLPNLTADDIDLSELSKQRRNQKLILMGRLLRHWVNSGKVSQDQYLAGVGGMLNQYNDNSDRALFGLSPLPLPTPAMNKKTGNNKPKAIETALSGDIQVPTKQEVEVRNNSKGDRPSIVPTDKPKQNATVSKVLKSTQVSESQFAEW